MTTEYNTKNSAVKRILSEASDLYRNPGHRYEAQPTEDNIFEWHFTISGPPETEFQGGKYHGRIILPAEYPYKPPSILFLTANGRFELHKKICLSVTGYHPEYWMPAWGIRTVLLAIIGYMPQSGGGAIGAIECSPKERQRLALKSRSWTCEVCKKSNSDILPDERVAMDGSNDQDKKEKLPSFSFSDPKPSCSNEKISTPTTTINEPKTTEVLHVSEQQEHSKPSDSSAAEIISGRTRTASSPSHQPPIVYSHQTHLVANKTSQLDFLIAGLVSLLGYLVYLKMTRA